VAVKGGSLNDLRKWLLFRFNQEMNMVAHQYVSVQKIIVPNLVRLKNFQIPLIIISILKYSLSLITLRDPMTKSPLKFYCRSSS
jgi:hypothetical protein